MQLPVTLGLVRTSRIRPRLAGLLHLLAGVGLWLGEGTMTDLLVDNSITATAANVLKHRTEYTAMFAFNLLSVAFMVAALPLLREIVRPVNERLARLAVNYGLVACAVQSVLNVFLYAALALIDGTPYRDAFRPVEFQAIAHLCMSLFGTGMFVALVFFGLFSTVLGYLVFTSTFLPRALGVVVGIAGFSWVMMVLVPSLLGPIGPYVLVASLIGPPSLGIWLLAKGVNKERWNQRAGGGRHDQPPDGPPDVDIDLPMTEALALASGNITSRPKLVK